MRKAGMGRAGLKKQMEQTKKMNEVGQKVQSEQLESMKTQLVEFQKNLELFATEHKKEINQNPVFRNQFLSMCKEIGVDPLASKKGFWDQMLGVADFYYELAIQVVNICIATRKFNGGFLEESDCLRLLKKMRKSSQKEVSTKDLERAIEELKDLGSEFRMIQTGNKKVICSVSIELTQDHMVLMNLAEENGGWITFSLTRSKLPQFSQKDRFLKSINFLLKEGMAWEDAEPFFDASNSKGKYSREVEDDGKCYWFPAVMQGGAQITESMDSAVLQEALKK